MSLEGEPLSKCKLISKTIMNTMVGGHNITQEKLELLNRVVFHLEAYLTDAPHADFELRVEDN